MDFNGCTLNPGNLHWFSMGLHFHFVYSHSHRLSINRGLQQGPFTVSSVCGTSFSSLPRSLCWISISAKYNWMVCRSIRPRHTISLSDEEVSTLNNPRGITFTSTFVIRSSYLLGYCVTFSKNGRLPYFSWPPGGASAASLSPCLLLYCSPWSRNSQTTGGVKVIRAGLLEANFHSKPTLSHAIRGYPYVL